MWKGQTFELYPKAESNQRGVESPHPIREYAGGKDAHQAPTAQVILELRDLDPHPRII